MKIVKISAVWCGSCIKMKKIWNEIEKEYSLDTLNLDYDFDEDEVKKYNVGDILPVAIFFKNDKEIKRLIGEKTKEEIIEVINEKN